MKTLSEITKLDRHTCLDLDSYLNSHKWRSDVNLLTELDAFESDDINALSGDTPKLYRYYPKDKLNMLFTISAQTTNLILFRLTGA